MQNTTTAYEIDNDKTVTELGFYEKAHEARKACEARAEQELKWTKRVDGIWEAPSSGCTYRLVMNSN
ncbi:hypothetical protein [Deinococcus altitudinis]|uniref:hypothetical protein n=1 Tax=Deinococcus altitudinis TaxID=468914 RepID=UPI00389230C8